MPGMGGMSAGDMPNPMDAEGLGRVMQGGVVPPEVVKMLTQGQSVPSPMPKYDLPPEMMDRAQSTAPMPEYTMPEGFQPSPMPMVEPDMSMVDRPQGMSREQQPSYEEMMRSVIERFGSVENARRIYEQMNAPSR